MEIHGMTNVLKNALSVVAFALIFPVAVASASPTPSRKYDYPDGTILLQNPSISSDLWAIPKDRDKL